MCLTLSLFNPLNGCQCIDQLPIKSLILRPGKPIVVRIKSLPFRSTKLQYSGGVKGVVRIVSPGRPKSETSD